MHPIGMHACFKFIFGDFSLFSGANDDSDDVFLGVLNQVVFYNVVANQ